MDKYHILHDFIYVTFKKKVELIYNDRSQNRGYLWIRVLIRVGHKGGFRSIENVLCLYLGDGFTDAQIGKNSWTVQLRFIYSTGWKLCLKK